MSNPFKPTHARGAVALALLAVLLAPLAFAQNHAHGALPGVTYQGVDYAFQGPESIEAGLVNVTFQNNGQEPHHLQIARLNDGVTVEQLQAALQQGPEAALPLVELAGGVGVIMPGQSQSVVVDLSKPGTYVELCFVGNAEGVPHLALGMIKFFEVVAPATPSTATAPEADLTVHMVDFGFDIPDQVAAGPQVWEVVNNGPQPHEMILMKLGEGKTMDDVMAFMQSGQGEAPGTEIGGAQGMSMGRSNFVSFDLEPGQYIALCFIPDPATGQPHVALGMIDSFTVVESQAGN